MWFRGTLVVILALVGCMPLRQIELAGTLWDVISIDGDAVEVAASIQFVDRYDVILIDPCGSLTGTYGIDTDGDYIELFFVESQPVACRGGAEAQHGVLVDALRSVQSWAIISEEEIELRGTSAIRLSATLPPPSGP